MENKLTPELIEKAKQAKSPEELLALAKEHEFELTEDEAKEYFERLSKSGEISDEELDNVSGGGCHTTVGGKEYTIVTCGCNCFTGQYEHNYMINDKFIRDDNHNLRVLWSLEPSISNCRCGSCIHLAFKRGDGYCDVSAK
ncbi:MAG: Nif11-like leader peptide family RiPP precursor [Oscillospiraceae bacterium]|nr:Nif11-like leader peptide family RiPP precursor [Oscillospiraceae bacterium]